MNGIKRNIRVLKVWIILIFVFFNHASAQTGWLNWEQDSIPALPFSKGLSGAFIGIHNEVLIVAGGSYFNKSKWDRSEEHTSELHHSIASRMPSSA